MQDKRRKAAVLGACLIALGAGACSESGAFPNLGRMPVMDERLLTAAERQEAIRAMREEQGTHDKDAADQIEGREPGVEPAAQAQAEQVSQGWTAAYETEDR